MRRLLTPLAAVLLLLFGVACSDDDVVQGPSEDATDDDGGGDASIESSVTVELLDAGQEPRQVLRLKPPADCEQRVTQRQVVTQEIVSGTLGGQPIPPAQLAAMNQDSTSSGNEFDATYRCQQLEGDRIEVVNRFDDVRTLGSIRTPETDRLLEGFVGAEGRLVYDAQGRILEADAPDIEIDEDVAGPAFAQGMEQMLDSLDKTIEQSANPFPEEPVGVGGVWRVTAEVDVLGLETTSVTEYSVTRIEDDLVEANLTISLDLPGGDISLPGMPAAAGAEIVDGSMLGSGTSTWQLDSVVSYFEQVLDGTLTMRISSDDQAIELSMRQHQELSLQPR